MANTIQIRRNTTANWTSDNPVLLAGEIAYDSTTNQIKIGDGTTEWLDLPYSASTIAEILGLDDALALKADKAIAFTALADNTTALNLASFAGGQAVTISYTDGLNKTQTWNDDLKDGRMRYIIAYNSHATTIGITPPAGIGDPFPAYCPTTKYLRLTFVWNGTAWIRTYSGVWE